MLKKSRFMSIFCIFLRLGLTSFGGPVAHLGYFRTEFVERQQWLDDKHYADLVALCQFLPGPASSQVGLSIGFLRGGYGGALAAWLGFTLPSAIFLILFALLLNSGDTLPSGLLQGLKIAAVAVVAQAIWGMAKQLCPDILRKTIAILVTCWVLLVPSIWGQMSVIVLAALLGYCCYQSKKSTSITKNFANTAATDTATAFNRAANGKLSASLFCLVLFFALLFGLPLLAQLTNAEAVDIADAYYRSGSLVFGGGHVVLPLLQAEVVPSGWISNATFLAGYGVTQAVPGPLFTFAAFLGASSSQAISGVLGGLLALIAIFLPSFLLVIGLLPFWSKLRHLAAVQGALAGVNAAVVGLLSAAFYQPVWIAGIHQSLHVVLALLAFAALTLWKVPPWLVVILAALMGWGMLS